MATSAEVAALLLRELVDRAASLISKHDQPEGGPSVAEVVAEMRAIFDGPLYRDATKAYEKMIETGAYMYARTELARFLH